MKINRYFRHGRSYRLGFTLVELLVVISIIALLLAILIPSLGKARTQAKKVVCLSNLRQLGVYDHMYQINNDDYVIPTFNNYPGWPSFVDDMYKISTAGGMLLGQLNDIMFCPGMRKKPDMSKAYSAGYGRNYHYGGEYYRNYKITEFKQPSQKIIIADATCPWPYGLVFEFRWKHIDWWRHLTYGLEPDGKVPPWNSGMYPRFAKKGDGAFNVLWLDGHSTTEDRNSCPMSLERPYNDWWLPLGTLDEFAP